MDTLVRKAFMQKVAGIISDGAKYAPSKRNLFSAKEIAVGGALAGLGTAAVVGLHNKKKKRISK